MLLPMANCRTSSWKGIVLIGLFVSPFFLNAQEGPGGIGKMDEGSNLALWLRADKQVETKGKEDQKKVAEWVDLGPNNFSLKQEDPEKRPVLVKDGINGKPSLKFNKHNNTFLKGERFKGLLGVKDYTVFLVTKNASIDGQVLLSGVRSTDGGRGKPGLYIAKPKSSFHPEQKGKSNYRFTHRCPYRLAQNSGTNVYTTANKDKGENPTVLAFSKNRQSKQQVIKVNSQQINQKTVAKQANQPFTTPLDLTIGTLSDWMNSMNLQGEISEIIVFNRELSQVEKSTISKYLHKRYRIEQPAKKGQQNIPEPVNGLKGIGQENGQKKATLQTGQMKVKGQNYLQNDGQFFFAGYTSLKIPNSFVALGAYPQISNNAWWLDFDQQSFKKDKGKVAFQFSFDQDKPGKAEMYRLILKSSENSSGKIMPVKPKVEGNKLTFFIDAAVAVEMLPDNKGWMVLGTKDPQKAALPDGLRPENIGAESRSNMMSY